MKEYRLGHVAFRYRLAPVKQRDDPRHLLDLPPGADPEALRRLPRRGRLRETLTGTGCDCSSNACSPFPSGHRCEWAER